MTSNVDHPVFRLGVALWFLMLTSGRDVGQCEKTDKQGGHCFSPGEYWQHDGTCIHIQNAKRCNVPDTREFMFTLRISIRQLRFMKSKSIVNLWIRGSGAGLSWNKPEKLQKSASGVGIWVTDISYTYDSHSLLCTRLKHCLFNQRAIEFRVYRDKEGKEAMMGPNLYVNLPVSSSMVGSSLFITPVVNVYPWFGGRSIILDDLTLSATSLGDVKTTLLYPPSFYYNARRKYPVVIMFGSTVSLQISPLLELMYIHEASIQEAIVIVLHHNSTAPYCEFNPYQEGSQDEDSKGEDVNLIWRCKMENCKTCHHCWDPEEEQKCDRNAFISSAQLCLYPTRCSRSALGEAWLDLIEEHLIPQVVWKSQSRVLVDFPKDRLTVIGFDGTGLLACHAAITRPHIYKNAACLSAPFHWPLNSLITRAAVQKTGMGMSMENASRNFMFYPELFAFHVTQKYYIDYGGMDNAHFPVIDIEYYINAFVNQLHEMFDVPLQNVLKFKKLPMAGNDYHLYPEGGVEILNRIKLPLLFFLGAEGGPNEVFPLLQDAAVKRPSNTGGLDIPDECLVELQLDQRKRDMVTGVPLDLFLLTIGNRLTW